MYTGYLWSKSMTVSTATNPWSNSGNDLLSLLNERGYKVTETLSGKYSVDLGNGKKVEFEKWEPLWTVLNRIENAPAEVAEKPENDNIIKKWKNEYLKSSEEASQAAEEARIKENYFAGLLANAKKSLYNALEPYKKFNVKKSNDLSKVETYTLGEERALHEAEIEADKCDGDISEYAHLKQHYNLRRGSYLSKAFMDACSAMKFSYMG